MSSFKALVVCLTVLAAGCDRNRTRATATTVELPSSDTSPGSSDQLVLPVKVKILRFFDYQSHKEMDTLLEEFINNSGHRIIRVVTYACPSKFCYGKIARAEIYYIEK